MGPNISAGVPKCNGVPVLAMQAYWGSRSTSPFGINHDNRRSTPYRRPLCRRGKIPGPLNTKLGGPYSGSGRFKENNLLPEFGARVAQPLP